MPDSDNGKPTKLIGEPLVHFGLLAALLFVVGGVFGGSEDAIEVSRAEIEWRIVQLESERGSRLNAEERELVEEAYIEERVLVREALALGLSEDERIDDILVQKMLHVLSGDVIQPEDGELESFYRDNLEHYRRPARVSVDELVVEHDAPLPPALLSGGEPSDLTPGAVIAHRIMPGLAPADLALLFGNESAESVFGVEDRTWIQAYESVRGDHWFRVTERFAEETPALDDVRDVVRRDWIAAKEEERLAQRVAELRDRYTIVVEGDG